MGHYASEMGYGGPSEYELKRIARRERVLKALAKVPLSRFPASMAHDLVLATDPNPEWKHRQDSALDHIEAHLKRIGRKRKA